MTNMEIKHTNINTEEIAFKELLGGYTNLFSHYLIFKGETVTPGDSKKEILDLLNVVAGKVSFENEDEKNAVYDLLSSFEKSDASTYADMAESLGFLEENIVTPLDKLRAYAFAEMERGDPEASKEYVKSIL